ncbi:MAG TPA: succinate--CoA ligase subunit alpha [Chloroflexota bacterium]|nr:succinate--CoA ligase subunit alpha [Chloroflexota bacterium]
MSILIDDRTKLLVQGITGREGNFHTTQMQAFGTNVVAGVTPGKGGSTSAGVPVFNYVEEAVRETGANASVVFVPGRFAGDAVMEAAAAGVELIVAISEWIPVHDSIAAITFARSHGARVIGPNCPGLTSAGKAKIGIMPNYLFQEGRVGVVSRSGTLTYEMVDELSSRGVGQSTVVGIGGDPVIGTSFLDVVTLFDADRDTDLVVLIGEIGGRDEEIAAEYIAGRQGKPVLGFISGRTAPPGKRMGHAGAIITGGEGGPEHKVDALRRAGVQVFDTLGALADRAAEVVGATAAV